MKCSLVIYFVVLAICILCNDIKGFVLKQQKQSITKYHPLALQQFTKMNQSSKKTSPIPIKIEYLNQMVDNFNPQNHATFRQRYFSNKIFHQSGGPIFVYISNEPELTPDILQGSMLLDLSMELHGCIYALEPRFYGESFPTENVTDENLRFLSTDQNLADIAHFVEHVRNHDLHRHHHVDQQQQHEHGHEHNHDDSPVIIVGIGYAGALAAWFRQLYPHLADIAWASSARVLSIINYSEFKVIAGAAYRQVGGNECFNIIEAGFADMEQIFKDGRQQELGEIFNVCETMESDDDITALFSIVSGIYSDFPLMTQYYSLENICEILTQTTSIESLAHLIALAIDNDPLGEGCLPANHKQMIDFDRETDLNAVAVRLGIRQSSYLTCTQLGWFITSDSEFQPFGTKLPEEYFRNICHDVFGDLSNNLEQNSARTNVLYGGLEPQVTRVIYTQGMLDPWRLIGVQDNINDLSPAFVIDGIGGGADIWSIDETQDSQNLVQVKQNIADILRDWIAELPVEKVHPH